VRGQLHGPARSFIIRRQFNSSGGVGGRRGLRAAPTTTLMMNTKAKSPQGMI